MELGENERQKSYQNYQPITDRTFEFSLRIINLCNFLNSQSPTSKLLANQLFRSGTSMGANIEESQAAQSTKDKLLLKKQEKLDIG